MNRMTIGTGILAALLGAGLVAQQDQKDVKDHEGEAAQVKEWLQNHPKMRIELKTEADRDGNKRLDKDEVQILHKLIHMRWVAHKKVLKARLEKIHARNAERRERAHDRLDRNDDGKVGPVERHRAKKVHDRVDRNGDGKVGPRERHRAKKVHDRVDRNGDGKVGPRERVKARVVHRRKTSGQG